MGKIITLAIIITLFISCKKDIHCNCKITTEQNNPYNSNDTVNGKITTTYLYVTVKNSTIKQASKRECSSYITKTEPTRYNEDSHGNISISYQTVTNVDCILK